MTDRKVVSPDPNGDDRSNIQEAIDELSRHDHGDAWDKAVAAGMGNTFDPPGTAPGDPQQGGRMTNRKDEWPDLETNPPGPRKVLKWVVIGIVALFVLGAISFIWSVTVGSGATAVRRVTNPDRLIATYEGYYDKCTSVVKLDADAKAAKAEYTAWKESYDSKNDPFQLQAQEGARLRTNVTGIEQRRREVAAEFNSQSLQITRLNGLTKGSDLPIKIEEGVTPQCGNFETVEVP
jgi:hypothetical protein